MNRSIALEIHDTAGNTIAQYHLESAGGAQHIDAVSGAYYQFTDLTTGLGPEGLTTARAGDDLLVHLDGDKQPELVIENYYSQGQGALVGMQENGGFASYPVASAPEHTLASEIVTEQPLGADQPALAPLGVLGAVGLVTGSIAFARDHGYKGDSGNNPQPQPSLPQKLEYIWQIDFPYF